MTRSTGRSRSSFGKSFIISVVSALVGGLLVLNMTTLQELHTHLFTFPQDEAMDAPKETTAPEEPAPEEPAPKEDPPPYFKVAQYKFPSVQERLQYYMGSWYNKFDWTPTNATCQQLNKVRDSTESYEVATLFTTTFLKECKEMGWRKLHMSLYCGNAYDQINEFVDNTDSSNNRWLVLFGDRVDIDNTLPIIVKARASALSHDSKSITWLLNEGWHYRALTTYHNDIVKKGKEIPWSEKESKVFWRGVTTGTRMDKLAQWINYDDKRTDIAFSNVVQQAPGFIEKYMKRHHVRRQTTIPQMNRYKYLLCVEGNDVATGLKWMLYSNSVVFMSRPTVATWAMEDLLLPFVHYIPLANDYSNLLQMVQWAEEHDEACQEISKRATEFMEHLWISDQAKKDTEYLKKTLVTSYAKQFDGALSKCDLVP